MRRSKNIYFPVECFYCGIAINNKYEHTYDHINPLAAGGKDKFENLADCCYRCNRLKADKPFKEFKAEIQQKLENTGKKAEEYAYFNAIMNRLNTV